MDFISIGIILLACRPRKTWPAFFTLGINELDIGRERGPNGQASRRVPAPFMKSEINNQLMFEDYDQTRTSSFGSAGSIGSNEAVLFLNPTKYSLDKEELQAYLNGTIYDYNYDDNEIVPEESPSKEDVEYKQLAETINKLQSQNDLSELRLDSNLITKEVCLGYRDKKQLKKIKKEAADAPPEKKGLFSRMFTRNTNQAAPVPQEDPEE